MSVTALGRQPTMATVEAVVYPACCCGVPWTRHRGEGSALCQGYRPQRPIEDLGAVAYRHARRWCRLLHAIEAWCRRWRMALEQKG